MGLAPTYQCANRRENNSAMDDASRKELHP
jgi:hypothetical protein